MTQDVLLILPQASYHSLGANSNDTPGQLSSDHFPVMCLSGESWKPTVDGLKTILGWGILPCACKISVFIVHTGDRSALTGCRSCDFQGYFQSGGRGLIVQFIAFSFWDLCHFELTKNPWLYGKRRGKRRSSVLRQRKCRRTVQWRRNQVFDEASNF